MLKWICKDLQGLVSWPGCWLAAGWAGVFLSPPTLPVPIFPAAWRAHRVLVLADLPETISSQCIKARKGSGSGSWECETPGGWGAGFCTEDTQRAGFINSYAAPGTGNYSHLFSCLADLLKGY